MKKFKIENQELMIPVLSGIFLLYLFEQRKIAIWKSDYINDIAKKSKESSTT